MRRSITADDAIRILAEWAAGRTYPEIAADLGLAENAVEMCIQRSSGPDAERAKSDHHINMTARKSAFYTGKRKDAERDQRVLTEWAEGQSAGKIGKALNMTRNTVIGIVHRSKDETIRQARAVAVAARTDGNANGAETKRAKSARQRDETAQAMVERRAAGKLLRQEPRLELVSSVKLPPRRPEPPEDLYAHLRTEGSLRKALAGLSRPRDIGTGVV